MEGSGQHRCSKRQIQGNLVLQGGVHVFKQQLSRPPKTSSQIQTQQHSAFDSLVAEVLGEDTPPAALKNPEQE